MSKQKTSFSSYMKRIQEEGICIESEKDAYSNLVKMAIEDYGKDDVRNALRIILPQVIEKSCENQIKMFEDDRNSISNFYRNVAEGFRENYNRGLPIQIGPFIFIKKYLEELEINSVGR
ncbi:MAG: hypothetical protein HY833_01150 [Candidatus Aenigmarchaeota archaeon]|nr:hypothetical protein [Candidatus Aenigmarchaeota archaeon]